MMHLTEIADWWNPWKNDFFLKRNPYYTRFSAEDFRADLARSGRLAQGQPVLPIPKRTWHLEGTNDH